MTKPIRPTRRDAMAMTLAATWLANAPRAAAQALPPTPGPPPEITRATVVPPWRLLGARAVLERIAIGSCLDQRLPQPIWDAVIAGDPQLMLMIGDNVYGDVKGADLAELKRAYAHQAVQPDLARARARFPFLAIWDDHDYGLNDAGGDFAWKAGTRELFHAFWQSRPAAGTGDGVNYARIVGPPGQRVQIIMLDTRSFRSPLHKMSAEERKAATVAGIYLPDPDPAKTMLGTAQWSWLARELARPAEIRILVSSIQLLATSHGWEKWGNLPTERARMLALLAKSRAKGLLVLSGDRHRAAIYRHPATADGTAPAYPLVEVTASAMNRPARGDDGPDPLRLAPMYREENFGRIAIDWRGRRLTASLHGQDGREVGRLALTFAELGLR